MHALEENDWSLILKWKVKKIKVVLYSAVSSPLYRSKCFTLFAFPDRSVHSDTNSASPGSILARQQLRANISTTVYSQVLVYTAEWTGASMERKKMPNLRNGSNGGGGFEPGLSRLRVLHSTTELSRSTWISSSLWNVNWSNATLTVSVANSTGNIASRLVDYDSKNYVSTTTKLTRKLTLFEWVINPTEKGSTENIHKDTLSDW